MNTMALTEETAPRRMHSNALSVVSRSRPQSSAFKMREPFPDDSPFRGSDSASVDTNEPKVSDRFSELNSGESSTLLRTNPKSAISE
jgi:hypothetical protein